MKALVYHGPGAKNWEDVPIPRLTANSDAIVRVDTTTICGTVANLAIGARSLTGSNGSSA